MIKNGLWHKDIRIPAEAYQQIKAQPVDVVLSYTFHALEASQTDRYGKIELPATINWSDAEVVEIEVVAGKVFKVVARLHHDSKNDLVIVVLLNGYKVKTVWLNRKNDKHRTLDISKYNQ